MLFTSCIGVLQPTVNSEPSICIITFIRGVYVGTLINRERGHGDASASSADDAGSAATENTGGHEATLGEEAALHHELEPAVKKPCCEVTRRVVYLPIGERCSMEHVLRDGD